MQKTLAFLQELEILIPPPSKCHHVLMAGQYGSGTAGWQEKLVLQVNKDGKFYPFIFDAYDMAKPISVLVAEVVDLMRQDAPANWQVSNVAGTPGESNGH